MRPYDNPTQFKPFLVINIAVSFIPKNNINSSLEARECTFLVICRVIFIKKKHLTQNKKSFFTLFDPSFLNQIRIYK